MANNTDKIAELEAILQSGIATTNINGTVVTRDFDVIRQQLAELRAQDVDPANQGRKPRIATIVFDCGGQW